MSTLKTKIKIMALLELIFNRPKNDRSVTFETIAKVTGLQVKDVETLVIKAMSKNLIKGSIDQVIAADLTKESENKNRCR